MLQKETRKSQWEKLCNLTDQSLRHQRIKFPTGSKLKRLQRCFASIKYIKFVMSFVISYTNFFALQPTELRETNERMQETLANNSFFLQLSMNCVPDNSDA